MVGGRACDHHTYYNHWRSLTHIHNTQIKNKNEIKKEEVVGFFFFFFFFFFLFILFFLPFLFFFPLVFVPMSPDLPRLLSTW